MKRYILIATLLVLSTGLVYCQRSDADLRRIREQDRAGRDPAGSIETLTAAEHLSRAEAYSSNRMFPEAREHWLKVVEEFPNDAGVPKALFGIARSYMWERKYADAVTWFDRLTKDYLSTKDGREGLAFKGASYVRMGKNVEAARVYEQYVTMFPDGERIESAHLNIIDAYREAGQYDDANKWVDRTVERFSGKPSQVNALHARLRMEIFRKNWPAAINAADQLLNGRSFSGSMASADEVRYLRAFAFEMQGKRTEAKAAYSTVAAASYFAGPASDRQIKLGSKAAAARSTGSIADFPVPFRTELIREAEKNKIDPRLLLAIMKQESSFGPRAKSPAGARGLLQLVFDTAIKYKQAAGFPDLQPDDLYNPAVNIAVGSVYIAALKDEFGGLYEAIAAGYNGGEDNTARWLNRSEPKDAGIFASEIGFAETKDYVFKVMMNYRTYCDLYTEDLERR